jgi:flagellar protein FlbT
MGLDTAAFERDLRTHAYRSRVREDFTSGVLSGVNGTPTFLINGEAPILRERDILTAETANTPVKRLYLCIQMMYLEDDIPKYQDLYMDFVKDLLQAVPRFRPSIETASKLILSGSLYNSLKEIQKLIEQEAELLAG